MGSSIFFFLLSSFFFLLSDGARTDLKEEKISLCYGVLYGSVVVEQIKFFAHYYSKLGVNNIVSYLHPNISGLFPQFKKIPTLSITMWNDVYNTSIEAHRKNHRMAIEKCINDEIKGGATAIIVCDPDEFLYFDFHSFPSLQALFQAYRKKRYSQVAMLNDYYELGLCTKKQVGNQVTIWDRPYRTYEIPRSTKSFFFTEDYLGMTLDHPEHIFNVSGETATPPRSTVRFLHYRQFPVWKKKDCQIGKEHKELFVVTRDTTDPGKKGIFLLTEPSEFFFDWRLEVWKDFVERGYIGATEKEMKGKEISLSEPRDGEWY